MTVLRLTILLGAMGLVAAWSAAESPKGYESLARKSIFSRDRTPNSPSSRPTTRSVASAPVSPVVTGIMRDDSGSFVAALETPGGSRPVFLRIGDALPGDRGVVTEMNLDCLVFLPLGGLPPRMAYVGRNLDGAESTLTPATTNPSDVLIEGDDIVSRMRRRRQQEGK
jgi:hypothetical protein